MDSRSCSAMASSRTPTRLIYCVDGTYCTPDGTNRQSHDNISNVYRVFASIKRGPCFDEDSKEEFIQDKFYEEGVGSADDLSLFDKAKAGKYSWKVSLLIPPVIFKTLLLRQAILTPRFTRLPPRSDNFTSNKAMLISRYAQGRKAKVTKRSYDVSIKDAAHSRNRTKFGYLVSAEERTSCER